MITSAEKTKLIKGAEQFKPGATGEIRTGVIYRNNFPPTEVKYRAIDGMAIFEGDIVLGTVAEMDAAIAVLKAKAIVVKDDKRWPGAVIPFTIDVSGFSAADQPIMTTRVNAAIQHWQTNTVIRFRSRLAADNDFLTFRSGTGCSCHAGRQGGQQFVNLSTGCFTAQVIHEIGHAVGLFHEQSREDRDKFITINWNNIQPEFKYDFNQHISDGDDSGPYDYDSIMHYGAFAFAIDTSKPTITAPQPIGVRTTLSPGDIAAVNAMYPVWTANVRIPGQQSKATPALASFGSLLHMVHLGDSANDIWHSTYNGIGWSPNVKIPNQKSKASPALAEFGGRLHMVHLGDGSNDIWHSTFDGNSWKPDAKIPNQQSKAAPALAVFNNQLHMVHLGDGSNDIWHSVFNGNGWTPNVRIPNQQTKASPALALSGVLHMVHLGDGSNDIWHSVFNGSNWTGNVRIAEQQSKAAPALAAFNNRLMMVHPGDGSNEIWFSVNDGTWRPNVRIAGQQSKASAAIAAYGGNLHMVHLGDGSNDIWHSRFTG